MNEKIKLECEVKVFPVADLIFRLMYLILAGIAVALFLFARRFKTGLRALLQMIGASVIVSASFFFVFVPNQHEYAVLMFDFVGAPLAVVLPLAAATGAVWATRHSGCLAMTLTSIVGIILGELVALAWIGGAQFGKSPYSGNLMIALPIYLTLLTVILIAWIIFGIAQQRQVR
jgi:hypothetical protein